MAKAPSRRKSVKGLPKWETATHSNEKRRGIKRVLPAVPGRVSEPPKTRRTK